MRIVKYNGRTTDTRVLRALEPMERIEVSEGERVQFEGPPLWDGGESTYIEVQQSTDTDGRKRLVIRCSEGALSIESASSNQVFITTRVPK